MDDKVVKGSENRLHRFLRILGKHMSSRLRQTRSTASYESQVVASQATHMDKASAMIQTFLMGRSPWSSFLICFGICDFKFSETVTESPDSEVDHRSRDTLHLHPLISGTHPSYNNPTCIINIHNSTLINCTFGNNNKQCVTYYQHALLSQNDVINVGEMETSQTHDQLIPAQEPVSGLNINMESSRIECATIGDFNNLTITKYFNSETKEDTEVEPDVNGSIL